MSADRSVERLRIEVGGAVQGVGFRPFVHRLAVSEGLGGFVCNTGEGATLEVEGATAALERFLGRLDAEIPPPADIRERRMRRLAFRGEHEFKIKPSVCSGRRAAVVLSDLATCSECLGEVFEPNDRRYRYPFTTCMHCGPRYSIIESVPYDRERTSMRGFPMCPSCRAEYENPASRRFHAETNACPACGPRLALWDARGEALAESDAALHEAVAALAAGRIVALKGLGGFQLLVDARNEAAVARLRECKQRPAKPFALMTATFADALEIAEASNEERRLLLAPAAPIVLLRSRPGQSLVAPGVAPDNPRLGIMLAYTPLHHLLLRALGFPVVATSGNRGEEPIVADEHEALERLAGLADLLLVHDRPILRPVDDSVARVTAGGETLLRRARGYAPLSLAIAGLIKPVLAVGGHQKNTVAVAAGDRLVLGPHVGDLGGGETRAAFARAIAGLKELYGVHPGVVACDLHPDYYSTRAAEGMGLPVRRVPHHLAHVLAGMADNDLEGPVLGVAWDGNGNGEDGTLWGGEFLAVEGVNHRRVAHLHGFHLPGGEAAMREPRRSALGALHASFGEAVLAREDLRPIAAFSPAERRVLAAMLARGVNSPLTSSAGRLFDAVAAILGLCQRASFEGEAAMTVEFAADRAEATHRFAPPALRADGDRLIADWRPMIETMTEAFRMGVSAEALAAGFHDWLVELIVAVAARVGIERVLLTGGCFQNARLTERAVARLRTEGFAPYRHRRIPPNDGGLAVGQALFAARFPDTEAA